MEVEAATGTLEEVELVRGTRGFGLLRLRVLRKELFKEVGDAADIPNGIVRISWTLSLSPPPLPLCQILVPSFWGLFQLYDI